MSVWDAGRADQPEEEREQQHAWEDPFDGDLPTKPRGPELEEWKPDGWRIGPMSPEERMFRDMIEADDEEDE